MGAHLLRRHFFALGEVPVVAEDAAPENFVWEGIRLIFCFLMGMDGEELQEQADIAPYGVMES